MVTWDWIVFGLWVGLSGGIGWVLMRLFLGLFWDVLGFSWKIRTIVNVLYDRARRIPIGR